MIIYKRWRRWEKKELKDKNRGMESRKLYAVPIKRTKPKNIGVSFTNYTFISTIIILALYFV